MKEKKWGKAFGYGLLTYLGVMLLTGLLAGNLSGDSEDAMVIFALLAGIAMFIVQLFGSPTEAAIAAGITTKKSLNAAREIAKEVTTRVEAENKESAKKITKESAYQIASEEIENKTYQKGLWAIAFADADGDEKKQQALYLKLRAKQLLDS